MIWVDATKLGDYFLSWLLQFCMPTLSLDEIFILFLERVWAYFSAWLGDDLWIHLLRNPPGLCLILVPDLFL